MHHRHSHNDHHHGRRRFGHAEEQRDGERHGDRHPERHGRRHGREGRGGGLGRFFAHGDLRLVILHLIAEMPRHGYQIIKAIEEQVAGAYSPSPGVIYPTLTLLEEMGYVTVSTGDGAKKLNTITPEGQAFLEANRRAVDALLARMAETSRAHGGGNAPQIVRAVENLKLALRLRLARGPLNDEQINAVAAALDAAATGIEQV